MVDIELIVYLKEASISYLKSYFIIDALSIIPGIVTLESNMSLYSFKLLRYFRIKRFLHFFKTINKIAGNLFSYNNQHKINVQKAISIIKLCTIYYFVFHVLSCIWLYIGET